MAGIGVAAGHPANPSWEPLRRQETLGSSTATPPPVARPFDRPPPPPAIAVPGVPMGGDAAAAAASTATTPMKSATSTPAPPASMIPPKTATPVSGSRSLHSYDNPHHSKPPVVLGHDRDYFERRSVDSGVRTPMLNTKRGPPRSRTGSIRNHNYPEEMDDADRGPGVDSAMGFYGGSEHHAAAAPSQPHPAQFLGNRGRPMSFYDMKERKKGGGSSILGGAGGGGGGGGGPSPPESFVYQGANGNHLNGGIGGGAGNRNSWMSANDMPYNYTDMIQRGGGGSGPPHMGRKAGYYDPDGGDGDGKLPLRLPWTMWMNSEIKNHFVCAIGEWVGTTMFLFFAFAGTQVANAQSSTPADNTTTNATAGFDPIVMLYIAISFGFSLMVNVWIFFRISGGLFNPAVTLALWATGALRSGRAITLFFAQIVGSITASALVLAIFPTPFNVRTTLSDGTSLVQGIFIEAIASAELVFTILMLAKEKHRATFIAPVGIGLALFTAELVAVYYTGGSLNPARSIGPCIVTGKFDAEHWIYWLGPFMGCVFAIAFYKFIKILEYEMANPGQDGDDENDPTKNSNHDVRERQRETTAKILARLGFIPPYEDHAYGGPTAATGMLADDAPFAGGNMHPDLERQMEETTPPRYHHRQGSSAGESMSMSMSMRGQDRGVGGGYDGRHDPALSTVASMSGSVKDTPPMHGL